MKEAEYYASTTPAEMDVAKSPRVTNLSGQQLTLYRALVTLDDALGAMYFGAIRAMGDVSNPERFVHSAHSLRELMEKMPAYLDVPTKAHKESLMTQVREMQDVYLTVQTHTTCLSAEKGWEGNVDAHLRRLLQRLDRFFDWLASHRPRRSEEMRTALYRMEGSGRSLPAPLASLNVKAWQEKRDYFQKVAHHGSVVDEHELGRWVDALERFLLERLAPRTFDDIAEIDGLLGEEAVDG